MAFLKKYSKYVFLTGFFLLIIGSLNFQLLRNIVFLRAIQNLILLSQGYIITLTALFCFFSFYLNRKELEEKSQRKEEENKINEERLGKEFSLKFPRLNKVPFFGNIGKWIYKEDWQGIGLILVFFIFLLTRLYYNDFVNGSDNHNVLAIKNVYENGVSFYRYHKITDFFMLKMVQLFGFNLFSIKIPFLFYSFITLIFIHLTGRLISKKIGLLSAFLFAISPWAIIQSRITRDYSFDLMIGSIAIYFSILLYKKIQENNDLSKRLKHVISFCFIPFAIILLWKYNRVQVLTTGIYPFAAAIFIFPVFFLHKIKENIRYVKIAYFINIISAIIAMAYLIDIFSFEFGLRKPDYTFLKMLFDPLIDSPWQWFYGSNIGMQFLIFFFILGIFLFNKDKKRKNCMFVLFFSLALGLFFFIFKHESHIDYIPSRYIYFLFVPYVIIFSSAILNLLNISENKILKTAIIIGLLLLVNYTSLLYSINPSIAYKREGISDLKIDNIGIGRFYTKEAANFLEEMGVNNDTVLVLDGRHEEFSIYLNRPMDDKRMVTRKERTIWGYNVSKNVYIQSNYYKYFELKKAVKEHNKGIFISSEIFIGDDLTNKKTYLRDSNFYLYDTSFKFIKNIGKYRIYSWVNA